MAVPGGQLNVLLTLVGEDQVAGNWVPSYIRVDKLVTARVARH